jgi:hypothetical protein
MFVSPDWWKKVSGIEMQKFRESNVFPGVTS